jgi:hypothetical protein
MLIEPIVQTIEVDAMAEPKTQATTVPIDDYLAALEPARREDAIRLIAWMREASGEPPVLWGSRIVGFGRYAYRYDSGRSGEAPLIGFGVGKAELSLYLSVDYAAEAATLARLGKHRHGAGCLYLKRLAGVDESALHELIERSVQARAAERIDGPAQA